VSSCIRYVTPLVGDADQLTGYTPSGSENGTEIDDGAIGGRSTWIGSPGDAGACGFPGFDPYTHALGKGQRFSARTRYQYVPSDFPTADQLVPPPTYASFHGPVEPFRDSCSRYVVAVVTEPHCRK
jgi:hypothetical protein